MRTVNKFYTSRTGVEYNITHISTIGNILTDRSYPYFIIYMNTSKEHVICIPGKTVNKELEQLKGERNKLIKLVNR